MGAPSTNMRCVGWTIGTGFLLWAEWGAAIGCVLREGCCCAAQAPLLLLMCVWLLLMLLLEAVDATKPGLLVVLSVLLRLCAMS